MFLSGFCGLLQIHSLGVAPRCTKRSKSSSDSKLKSACESSLSLCQCWSFHRFKATWLCKPYRNRVIAGSPELRYILSRFLGPVVPVVTSLSGTKVWGALYLGRHRFGTAAVQTTDLLLAAAGFRQLAKIDLGHPVPPQSRNKTLHVTCMNNCNRKK